MPRETDPRVLMDKLERRSLDRLGKTRRELLARPRQGGASVLDTVREHPHVALAVAAGGGFLLAPGGSSRAPTVREQTASVTRAGKLLFYAKAARSLFDLIGPGAAGAAQTQAAEPPPPAV